METFRIQTVLSVQIHEVYTTNSTLKGVIFLISNPRTELINKTEVRAFVSNFYVFLML